MNIVFFFYRFLSVVLHLAVFALQNLRARSTKLALNKQCILVSLFLPTSKFCVKQNLRARSTNLALNERCILVSLFLPTSKFCVKQNLRARSTNLALNEQCILAPYQYSNSGLYGSKSVNAEETPLKKTVQFSLSVIFKNANPGREWFLGYERLPGFIMYTSCSSSNGK